MNTTRNEADKHIYLGVLLKKDRPEAANRKILEVIERPECVDSQIERILEIDKSVRKRATAQIESSPRPNRRRIRGNPLVVLVDRQEELFLYLKTTSLRSEVIFQRCDNIDGKRNPSTRPALYVVNGSSFPPAIAGDLLRRARREACSILLGEIIEISDSVKGLPCKILEKPLHMTDLEDSIRNMLATKSF